MARKSTRSTTNDFVYVTSTGTTCGYFSIYQARNGGIFIMMGTAITELNEKQVNDLSIDVYSLVDFSYEEYKKHYGIK